jgi:drug/metabolite transporter (DMT)-like permease
MLLVWSSIYIFAKLALRGAPPLLVICLRTVLSGLIMVPVYLLRRRGPEVRSFTARDLPGLAAVGVLGIVGNQLFYVLSLSRTSVAHGAIVGATAPVLVLATAAVLGQERLTARKIGGLVTAAAGVGILQLGKATRGGASATGDLLMLGNAALFAAFSVLGKRSASQFGALTVNAVAFWGGGLIALPYAVWGLWRFGPASVGLVACGSIVCMSTASVVGYLIYSYALRYLPASRVSSTNYLQPLVATVLAVPILGEVPGPAYLAGAAVILGGVWAAQHT